MYHKGKKFNLAVLDPTPDTGCIYFTYDEASKKCYLGFMKNQDYRSIDSEVTEIWARKKISQCEGM